MFSNLSIINHNVKPIIQRCILYAPRIQYIPSKLKTNFTFPYCPEVEKVINRQIKEEHQAAQDYLNMAVYFLHSSISRPGTGAYFMNLHHEEIGHMHAFIQYQLCRGGKIEISSLNVPQSNTNLTMESAFERALLMELKVTELLEDVVKVAESVNDHQCIDFVVCKYLCEQIKSMNVISHHITKLKRLNDENSLYQYDLQLLKDCSHRT